MSTQQLPVTTIASRPSLRYWWLLGLALLVLVAGLAFYSLSARPLALTDANSTRTGQPVSVQAVPNASTQGVTNYIQAHNFGAGQTVPNAATQGVTNYIQAHNFGSGQTVPNAATQGVLGYIRAHGN